MSYVEPVPGAEGIYLVDTNQFGLDHHGAAYIVRGAQVAVVETGLSYSTERLLGALRELGISNEDVIYIVVTHIHLDHAGGAGFLAEACPNATVVVHERGARHLADPSRLVESVREATGPMFPRYGQVKPIPRERLLPLEGGEILSLGGGYRLAAIATPGHAPHHLCFLERRTGALFAGDAAGIWWPHLGRLLPTTPPPSFNLEQSLTSLERLGDLEPRVLLFTHFGAHPRPKEMLRQYAELLRSWVEEIEGLHRRLREQRAVEEEMIKRYLPIFQGYCDDHLLQHEIAMNTQGVLRYLAWRGRPLSSS